MATPAVRSRVSLLHGAAALCGVVVLALTSACGTESPVAPVDEITVGDLYLAHALDLLQANSLHRYEVDWEVLRDSVITAAGHPQVSSDTYPAIRLALELIGERHSFLREPVTDATPTINNPEPVSKVVEGMSGVGGHFGYIWVGQFSGTQEESNALATNIQRRIEALDAQGVCGWIVDLRGNAGGNMWPMVAGLGPLVGEGTIGYFVDPDSVVQTWTYENGASGVDHQAWAQASDPYRTHVDNPPVAVLIDQGTVSSGEATFIAFKGRSKTFSAGVPTYGLSTANAGFALGDGAWLFITTSVMADRTGTVYGDRVWADESIAGDRSLDPETDHPFRISTAWLAGQPACNGSTSLIQQPVSIAN